MKLSPSYVESALTAGRHSDGRGLYLLVSKTGAKSWVFMWKIGGRRREMGLGSYTGIGGGGSVSLKQARAKADETRVLIGRGVCPMAGKKVAKLASITFAQLMNEAIANLTATAGWKVKNGVCEQADEWTRTLTTHAAQIINKGIATVDTDAVLKVLRPIWITIPETAERVRHRIEKVIDLAIVKQAYSGANPARYKGHIELLLGKRPTKKAADKKTSGHLALAYDDVPAFMTRLLANSGNAARGLAFTILTATRTDEARLAQWSEIDLDKAVWTIPAERMKAGVEHVVPLSSAALTVLKQMLDVRQPNNAYVFCGKKAGEAVGATAFSDKLCDPAKKGGLGLKDVATVHGFRSTFSDWVGDKTNFPREDREMCLAHGLDAVEGAYRRQTAVEKRRAIMEAWGNFAIGVDNVTPLRVAA